MYSEETFPIRLPCLSSYLKYPAICVHHVISFWISRPGIDLARFREHNLIAHNTVSSPHILFVTDACLTLCISSVTTVEPNFC
jgi:hypothetical protein